MKKLNVKQSFATVEFNLQDQELKFHLKKLEFFGSYYNFGSEIKSKIMTDSIIKEGLDKDLIMPFYGEAIRSLEKCPNNTCGVLYLNLLDDACLPIPNEMPYIYDSCDF